MLYVSQAVDAIMNRLADVRRPDRVDFRGDLPDTTHPHGASRKQHIQQTAHKQHQHGHKIIPGCFVLVCCINRINEAYAR